MERPMATRSSSSSSHTHTSSSSMSGRLGRDTANNAAPHPHQQQVPSRSARQTRNPIHRESQHYPMAERCMCSSCHLSAKLFPRTGDGRIMLPVVPVTRNHATAHAHIGHHGAEGSDLAQYMLAPNDMQGGLGRSSKSSTASEVTITHMVPPRNSMPPYHEYSHDMDLTCDPRPPAVEPGEHESERDDQLDNDGDTEMKVPHPTLLTGPGVAGSRSVSRFNSHPCPNHPPQSSDLNPPRQSSHDHDYETAKSSGRPRSSSYTGPPLPPHPALVLQLSSMVMNPTAKRGRPKGKGKSKPGISSVDNFSDGASSTRNSPNLPLVGPNYSQPLQYPASHQQSANGPPNVVGPLIGASAAQQDLAPCKPRRGRPPRHEVVPGMGEFTVFL